jgi:pimeloyl-ACP methyl ester carboxylesterase
MERMKFANNPDDGVRIAYELVGEGAPLLLFHGTGASGAVWAALGYVDALRDRHQLILIDARGHGHSEKPTRIDAYAMERIVGDVIAVLDDCGLAQTAYLGYSMGGRVGFGLLIDAPERVGAAVLGGASHCAQRGALDRMVYPGFVDTIEMEGTESFLERWSERLGRAIDPVIGQMFLGNDSRALVPYLRQIDREPGFDDGALSRVQVPVLLFAGARDHERLADSRAAAAILPSAELAVIPDSDHESTLAQVDVVLPCVLEFLNREG